jgi:hypothetical protein
MCKVLKVKSTFFAHLWSFLCLKWGVSPFLALTICVLAPHLLYWFSSELPYNSNTNLNGSNRPMKNVMYKLLIAIATLSSASAFAGPGLKLGIPASGGSGCPAGSVSATLSPDDQQLSILFDSFAASAGGDTNKTSDRKSCNIAIPVSVPPGYSVSILSIDYRGYNNLPRGATSSFSAEYFLAGQRGPRFVKDFTSANNGDFLFNNRMGVLAWTPCGAQTVLRVNASAQVRTPSWEQADIIVDSADIDSKLVYYLQFQRCR